MPNFSNYVSCYNRVNKTNYRSILQLPKQNLGNINMSNLSYCKKNTDLDKAKVVQKSKISYLKTIYQMCKQFRNNMKAFGVSNFDLIKNGSNNVPVMSANGLFGKIKSQTTLSSVPIKMRNNNKVVHATFEKLDFGHGTFVYILKNKNKQLGYIDVTRENSDMHIDFMTNILGRKKYKNIENILIQGMVEDCMKQGFVPNLKAVAADVGANMGRGYNNNALYRRMGMSEDEYGFMRISKEKVLELINKRIEKFGKVIK